MNNENEIKMYENETFATPHRFFSGILRDIQYTNRQSETLQITGLFSNAFMHFLKENWIFTVNADFFLQFMSKCIFFKCIVVHHDLNKVKGVD